MITAHNSVYNLASKGLDKVGLGKRKRVFKASIIRGRGFFRKLKNAVSSINNVAQRVIGIFTGRNKRRPTARRVIKQHGSELIKSIAVCREPVTSAVEKTMNLISLGGLNKAELM
jgi:hypothetical protein